MRKVKQAIKNNIVGFILGAFIFGTVGVSAATYYASKDVSYDNSSSGLKSTDVQSAIDELYQLANKKTVYSWNTSSIKIGESTISDLKSTRTSKPYYESTEEVIKASGFPVFNKYTVVDDVITEGYTCQTFGVLSTPVCVQGGDSKYYNYNNSTGNWSILNTLKSNNSFVGAKGYCSLNSSESSCTIGSSNISASSNGEVFAHYSNTIANCTVSRGNISCYGQSGGTSDL